MFLFIFETERDRTWAGEGQRDGETQILKRAPGSELSTQSLDVGLELTECEIMTWAEVGRLTDWATQAPQDDGNFWLIVQIYILLGFIMVFTTILTRILPGVPILVADCKPGSFLEVFPWIYVCVCVCVCVCTYMYVYVYIYIHMSHFNA